MKNSLWYLKGSGGGIKYWGKYSEIMFFFILPFKKVDRIVSILLMNCSFTRLISSYEDDDRHFIKMCFHRELLGQSNLEAQFLGWIGMKA